jgi:hypothetical protein
MTQLVRSALPTLAPLPDAVAAPLRELVSAGAGVDEATRLKHFTGFAPGPLIDRLVLEAGGVAAPALLTLYPAVHAAWCDGEADDEERRRILQAGWELELDRDPRGWALLEAWLAQPPPLGLGVLFQAWAAEAMRSWTAVRYEPWRAAVLALAREVAEASGGGWFSSAVSAPEGAWLESLAAALDPLRA